MNEKHYPLFKKKKNFNYSFWRTFIAVLLIEIEDGEYFKPDGLHLFIQFPFFSFFHVRMIILEK